MADGQVSPQQGQQDPLSPPGILKTLMGAIPVVGPGIYHRSLLQLALKRHREDQQIQADNNLFGIAQQYAENKDKILDPDTQNQWQQMVGEMALAKHGNPAKPFDKEIGQKFQDLHGFTKGQIASKQAQVPSQISSMPPPPSSMFSMGPGGQMQPATGPASAPSTPGLPGLLPQGAGAPKVPASPQGPAVAPQQPMEMTPPPGMSPGSDPMAILQGQAQDPNPLVRGPAINQLRNLIMGQAQASGRLQIVQQQLAASGRRLEDLPLEAQMDLLTGQPIRNLPAINPGQQIPSLGGGTIATSSVPRLQDVAPGGTLVSVPTQGGAPAASGGQSSMPPPPSAGAQTLLKSPGKVKEGPTFPDPEAKKTGYSQYQLDEVTGEQRGKVLDVVPPAGLIPEITTGQQQTTDAAGNIHQIPTTTIRRPLLGGMPAPPSGGAPASEGGGAGPPGGSPGPIVGAKPLLPQQREQMDAKSSALDQTTGIMTSVMNKLPLLNNMLSAGKIALGSSDSTGAQILSRASNLSPDEAQMAADMTSLAEHINTIRGALGATGFRGHEAFGALQAQRGRILGNPQVTGAILKNTMKSLLGQRASLQKELARAQGLTKPKLDRETAKAYMAVTDNDMKKAIDLATSQGYDVSK